MDRGLVLLCYVPSASSEDELFALYDGTPKHVIVNPAVLHIYCIRRI